MDQELNPWLRSDFVTEEVRGAAKNWYELGVNGPAIVDLIPSNAARILDYGCGPAFFTETLHQRFRAVHGCDKSYPMLAVAREKHPDLILFQWDTDSRHSPPEMLQDYDIVVAKLVVHLLDDLPALVRRLSGILTPGGSLIMSIPHPAQTAPKVSSYWSEVHYREQVGGKYGAYSIYHDPVHRSIERYIQILTDANFVITGLGEPYAPEDLIVKHGAELDYYRLPRRLNIRARKNN